MFADALSNSSNTITNSNKAKFLVHPYFGYRSQLTVSSLICRRYGLGVVKVRFRVVMILILLILIMCVCYGLIGER